MNFGPRKIVISIAAMPAIRIAPRSTGTVLSPSVCASAINRRPRRARATRPSVSRSRPTEREPLTSATSPSRSSAATTGDRGVGVGRPGVRRVVAGELADADQAIDPALADQRADLRMEVGGVGAELGHPAEDGDRAALAGDPDPARFSTRGAHRDRVRVVAVVEQQDAAREARSALPAGARTLSAPPAPPSRPGSRSSATPIAIAQSALSRLWASVNGNSKSASPCGVPIRAIVRPARHRRRQREDVAAGPEGERLERVAQVRGRAPPRPRGSPPARCSPSPWRISALASTIASSVPSSSRWTGPMFVIAATSGSAIAQSSAICPIPRIAISITSSSVSGGAASSASGIPISVLKFSGLAWTRRGRIARQMSLTDVLPVEPVIPTVGQPSSRRQARASACRAASGSATAKTRPPGALAREPRRRARGRRSTPQAPCVEGRRGEAAAVVRARPARPTNRSPSPSLARVDHGALGREPSSAPAAGSVAPTRRGDPIGRELDHRGRRSAGRAAASSSRATVAVVERDLPAAVELLPLLVALAGDHDQVARLRPAASARAIAARRSGSTSTQFAAVGGDALEDLRDDRLGVLGARVVGGDDREVRRARRRPVPSAAASADRDRRRSRRRRSARPSVSLRAARRTFSSESGVCA